VIITVANSVDTSVNAVVIRLPSLGLGNVFFQYAVAKAVAATQRASVLFDISGCCSSQMLLPPIQVTQQEVNNHFKFKMKFGFASPKQIRQLRWIPFQRGGWPRKIQRMIHLFGGMPRSYVKEKIIHQFQPEILALQAPVYLEGTFINPQYWQHIKSEVLADLVCTAELPEHLQRMRAQMRQEPSISIHVRRGDYASALTNNAYPLYGDDFVREAVAKIEQRVGKCRYYMFSDDPQWVQAHILSGTDAIHVSRQTSAAWVDLELMSACHHNVIGNSTFSWWGAYRNTNPNKIVVAPKKWRNDAIDTSSMLLSGWITLG